LANQRKVRRHPYTSDSFNVSDIVRGAKPAADRFGLHGAILCTRTLKSYPATHIRSDSRTLPKCTSLLGWSRKGLRWLLAYRSLRVNGSRRVTSPLHPCNACAAAN